MRGLYEIGRGGLMNKRTACLPDFFIRTGVPSLYLSDFFLFVCLFSCCCCCCSVVFFSSGLLRQPNFIDIFFD